MDRSADAASYARKKEQAATRSIIKSAAGRDIFADYRPAPNIARRESCRTDLGLFLKTYFPDAFFLPWSIDHPRILASMQEKIRRGGLQALAEPRGYGKTAKSLRAMLWAMLYAYCRFGCLIGPTGEHAKKLLKQIKYELTFNHLLFEDFPHVCYPIRRLESNSRKASGQLFRGEQTRIEWTSNSITFPVMPDEACAGAVNVSGFIVTVAGLTGSLRGQSHALPTGEIIRPEIVIADDPQTRDSAQSMTMTEERLSILTGDVLGMAGPGKEITVIVPCTVIETGDLADQILDRKKHPEWHGERTKAVYTWPTNAGLWQEYLDIRADEMRNGGDGRLATEFYEERRQAMDAGAVVAWPEYVKGGAISGLQHAYNEVQKFGLRGYNAEFQNEPLPDEAEAGQLTPDAIAARVNGLARGVVPLAATRLTAYVDVQQKCLYWLVAAWSDSFTGAVVDYGTWPDQGRRHFRLSDVGKTLARATPGAGLEGQIYAGLGKCSDMLLGREWRREDGATLKVERLLPDANWGASTDTVYSFCRQSPHAALLLPSHGRYVGAASRPWSEYQKKPGERLGFHWLVTSTAGKRATRHAIIDTNFWKSFVAERLSQPIGDQGALSFFGQKGTDHRMLAEHICSEYRVRTEGRGRTLDEWKIRAEHGDNHWLDCLTGATAAASIQGCSLPETTSQTARRGKISFAELQRRKRDERKRSA